MMKFNDIIKKSIFTSVGTLLEKSDIGKFLRYFDYNKNFIENFPVVIYSFNGNKTFVDELEKIVKKELPKSTVYFIFSENLGHTFGTFLSENLIFEKTKQFSDYEYVWKFSNDVIVTTDFFDLDVIESDFYYINNIGYHAIFEYKTKENLIDKIKSTEYFYPQTNYYIIKNKIKFLPELESIYKLHNDFINRDNKNLHPWDFIRGCDCESFLKKTVIENNLTKNMLLNSDEVVKIVNVVVDYKVCDGSHKNVVYERLGNLCHLQRIDGESLII